MKVFENLERQRNWSQDERLVLEQVKRVAAEVIAPNAAEVDRTAKFPWDNIGALKAIGLDATPEQRIRVHFRSDSARLFPGRHMDPSAIASRCTAA